MRYESAMLTSGEIFRIFGEPVFRYGNCFSGALIRASVIRASEGAKEICPLDIQRKLQTHTFVYVQPRT